MSKKNKRRQKVKNNYPTPNRTVIYSKKKHLKPIPEAGKKYHCFDDGKVTFSRHYIIEISEVLGQMEFKRKYPDLFEQYLSRTRNSYWLFSRSTDKFVVTDSGENGKTGVYVRTKQGGWFGIGSLFDSGSLDVTGESWKWLVDNIDRFDYSDEEKKKLIEEGTID